MDDLTRRLAWQVSAQLPTILAQLAASGHDPDNLQLECSLTPAAGVRVGSDRVQVAAVDLNAGIIPFASASGAARQPNLHSDPFHPLPAIGQAPHSQARLSAQANTPGGSPQLYFTEAEESGRSPTRFRRPHASSSRQKVLSPATTSRENSDVVPPRRKRSSGNPALQPSTFNKFIHGIWDSLYSSVRINPIEVIEQWQAIESTGHPQFLADARHDVSSRSAVGTFARMNILTRKISQTSKTFRSLEVIVQAYWVQCFDDRVTELATITTRDKAKKSAIAEACLDFNWTEKELRNKMGIWRGYHDIKNAAGWAALVFAGTGLYRFCKYRVSFSDPMFVELRALRHRFEVAADTLHRNWRMLLGIVGASTEPRYNGHAHDWVVNGPDGEAIPLFPTYYQWDPGFTYRHIDSSMIDEDAWGQYDPRTVVSDANLHGYDIDR